MARAFLACFTALLIGCTRATDPGVHLGMEAPLTQLGALGSCDARGVAPTLDPAAPVVVLVHGCNASQGRFRSLSQVFALHGQQTLCFRYGDRRRIPEVGRELVSALTQLTRQLSTSRLTLLGHSQGGLVARAAFADIAQRPLRNRQGVPTDLQLVTVSSPFNGIASAADCGATWLHVLSFGSTLAVCRAVAGAKWKDIHSRAELVRAPGRLSSQVVSHLEIRTDERDSCRRRALDGSCVRSDFVFSLDEQENPRIGLDQRVTPDVVRAGHAEIVGNDELPPRKLLSTLQRHQVLRPTPADKRLALRELLARLF